jgi:hypothetical protein
MGTYGKTENVDYNQLIANATPVDTLPPHCFPLDITADSEKLQTSFVELIKRLGFNYDEFMEQEAARSLMLQRTVMEADAAIAWDINLNHLPHLTGADRWGKHRGQFEHIFAEGVTPADYTKLLDELDGLYIKTVIESIYAHHLEKYRREFKGKAGVIWIGPHQGYNFHWDAPRTPIRYHVPLFTNERALWLFKDNNSSDIFKMHMPVGTVWEFYPVSIEHTVINQGTSIRAHMIITEVN